MASWVGAKPSQTAGRALAQKRYVSSPFEELGQRQTQPDCRDCASAEKSGPNERETVGMRPLRKKGPLP